MIDKRKFIEDIVEVASKLAKSKEHNISDVTEDTVKCIVYFDGNVKYDISFDRDEIVISLLEANYYKPGELFRHDIKELTVEQKDYAYVVEYIGNRLANLHLDYREGLEISKEDTFSDPVKTIQYFIFKEAVDYATLMQDISYKISSAETCFGREGFMSVSSTLSIKDDTCNYNVYISPSGNLSVCLSNVEQPVTASLVTRQLPADLLSNKRAYQKEVRELGVRLESLFSSNLELMESKQSDELDEQVVLEKDAFEDMFETQLNKTVELGTKRVENVLTREKAHEILEIVAKYIKRKTLVNSKIIEVNYGMTCVDPYFGDLAAILLTKEVDTGIWLYKTGKINIYIKGRMYIEAEECGCIGQISKVNPILDSDDITYTGVPNVNDLDTIKDIICRVVSGPSYEQTPSALIDSINRRLRKYKFIDETFTLLDYRTDKTMLRIVPNDIQKDGKYYLREVNCDRNLWNTKIAPFYLSSYLMLEPKLGYLYRIVIELGDNIDIPARNKMESVHKQKRGRLVLEALKVDTNDADGSYYKYKTAKVLELDTYLGNDKWDFTEAVDKIGDHIVEMSKQLSISSAKTTNTAALNIVGQAIRKAIADTKYPAELRLSLDNGMIGGKGVLYKSDNKNVALHNINLDGKNKLTVTNTRSGNTVEINMHVDIKNPKNTKSILTEKFRGLFNDELNTKTVSQTVYSLDSTKVKSDILRFNIAVNALTYATWLTMSDFNSIGIDYKNATYVVDGYNEINLYAVKNRISPSHTLLVKGNCVQFLVDDKCNALYKFEITDEHMSNPVDTARQIGAQLSQIIRTEIIRLNGKVQKTTASGQIQPERFKQIEKLENVSLDSGVDLSEIPWKNRKKTILRYVEQFSKPNSNLNVNTDTGMKPYSCSGAIVYSKDSWKIKMSVQNNNIRFFVRKTVPNSKTHEVIEGAVIIKLNKPAWAWFSTDVLNNLTSNEKAGFSKLSKVSTGYPFGDKVQYTLYTLPKHIEVELQNVIDLLNDRYKIIR